MLQTTKRRNERKIQDSSLVKELIEINNRGKEKTIAEPVIKGLFE